MTLTRREKAILRCPNPAEFHNILRWPFNDPLSAMGRFSKWRSLVDGEEISAIPDFGLDHLFWGPSIEDVSTFPDAVGDADMSANGDPTLTTLNDRQSVSYGGGPDSHDVATSFGLGDADEWTAVLVINPNDDGESQRWFSMGGGSGGYNIGIRFGRNDYIFEHSGVTSSNNGPPITGPQVIVATYDGSNAIMDVNGDEVINQSIADLSGPADKTVIANNPDGGGAFANGVLGAAGHEAAAADSERRDELTQKLADEFEISLSD